MVDLDLLHKKLTFIESCVADLERLARPEAIEDDVREERFVAHTLQLAIQAALDVAAHVVSDLRLGEPESNRELFRLLATHVRMDEQLRSALEQMAGFRNVLVHGYQAVDPRIVRAVLEHNLQDLLAYVRVMRQGLAR